MTQRDLIESPIEPAEPTDSLVLDLVANAFLDVDMDGFVTQANRAAVRLLAHGELLGKHLATAAPELLDSPLSSALTGGNVDESDIQFSFQLSDRALWCAGRVLPHPAGFSIYLRDVTAQHREAFANQIFRLSLEQRGVGVLVCTSQQDGDPATAGTIRFANVAAATTLGVPAEQLRERALSEVLRATLIDHPDGWACTPLPGASSWCADEYTKADRNRLVSIDVRMVQEPHTRKTHWLVMLEDVTEQRASDYRRKELDAVFEHVNEGVLLLDAHSLRCHQVNPFFCQISGYSAEVLHQFDASQWLRLLQGDTAKMSDDESRDRLSEGREERVHQQPSGRFCQILQRLTLVRDAESTPLFWVCSWIDRSEQQEASAEIEYLRSFDPLCGILNRAGLQARAGALLGEAQAHDAKCISLAIALENLTEINQHHGALAGDQALRLIAKELSAAVGSRAAVARVGPGRFVVLAPWTSEVNATDWTRMVQMRVRCALAETLDAQLPVGYAFYPDDADDFESLLLGGELAMSNSELRPDGLPERFQPISLVRSRERFELLQALTHAIEMHQLEVHYQPRVKARDGRVTGVEALVRWRHPRLGMISPVQFIPLAEESGIIHTLGQWVLETACHQVQRWNAGGDLALAVNLSPLQIARPDIVDQIEKALTLSGLPAHLLEVEITESVLLDDGRHVDDVFRQLKGLGIGLALDDFGTGFSSLAYLNRLPLDYLKIDRSFVKMLGIDARQTSVTEAIVNIGRVLGLTLIAEGVETLEQLAWLREHGCDEIQGFLFSKPCPAVELDPLLYTRRTIVRE